VARNWSWDVERCRTHRTRSRRLTPSAGSRGTSTSWPGAPQAPRKTGEVLVDGLGRDVAPRCGVETGLSRDWAGDTAPRLASGLGTSTRPPPRFRRPPATGVVASAASFGDDPVALASLVSGRWLCGGLSSGKLEGPSELGRRIHALFSARLKAGGTRHHDAGRVRRVPRPQLSASGSAARRRTGLPSRRMCAHLRSVSKRDVSERATVEPGVGPGPASGGP